MYTPCPKNALFRVGRIKNPSPKSEGKITYYAPLEILTSKLLRKRGSDTYYTIYCDFVKYQILDIDFFAKFFTVQKGRFLHQKTPFSNKSGHLARRGAIISRQSSFTLRHFRQISSIFFYHIRFAL
jgi:hypothetical protein